MPLNQANYAHISVLLSDVEKYSKLEKGDIVVDGTLGLGGHSELFLQKIGPKGKLIAFELDENNLKTAQKRLDKYTNQIIYIPENFVHLHDQLLKNKISQVNLVFLDLGLASTMVDQPERGFSFNKDGPLDMRFDTSARLTAKEVVNKYSEKRLESIFREYGEERYSKKLARIVVEKRPFNTTLELAEMIARHKPQQKGRKTGKIHPATQVFQALRIEVNSELDVLRDTLQQAVEVLAPGGRLMVISYHSLEDRIVKHFIKSQTKECICPPEVMRCQCSHKPELKIITKKPVIPKEEEIKENPRSRSAKMRVAEKL